MFKDARALDRQRTAASFDEALRRYAETTENFFDGSVGSLDRRLGVCDRLLHSARSVIGRLSTLDSRRYLRVAERLNEDRRALHALRDDLLTGASNREDVVGPPGWRAARTPFPQFKPEDFPAQAEWGGPQGHGRSFEVPGGDNGWEQVPSEVKTVHRNPAGQEHVSVHEPQWDPEVGDWAVPSVESDMTGGKPGFRPQPPFKYHPPGFHPSRELDRGAEPDAENVPHSRPWNSPPRGGARLAGSDRRWVELEAARFVAANPDALDNPHELAIRAHNHAALKTSTFSLGHCAAVCEAFVEQVVELGRRSYRPVRPRQAAFQDFPSELMYLT